jgi:cellulose synthase/poly-beta-1,6-N-acetylglucosamine synthase-like glycosyltransferase
MADPPNSERPFVSVVMTVLNMERTLDECLTSLENLDYPNDKYEIIVVDGKSRDGTQKIVQDHIQKTRSPQISLFEKEGLVGVGRNEAFKHSKGEIIAITDGDMVVPPDWLDNLVFEFEEGVGGVGGPNDNADTSLITKAIGCIDVQGPSFDVVPIRGNNPYTKPFVSSTNVYTTVCRNSAYKKKVLDEVKGFDERIISSDDPELNIKILKKGYKLKYTPKALVKHHHRSSISGFYRQQRRYAVSQAIAPRALQAYPAPTLSGLYCFGLPSCNVTFYSSSHLHPPPYDSWLCSVLDGLWFKVLHCKKRFPAFSYHTSGCYCMALGLDSTLSQRYDI